MGERYFTETVNTTEESGNIVIQSDGRLYIDTRVMNLGGRGWNNSKWGFYRRDGINDVEQRSVGSMMNGGITSWDSMSGSAITAVIRDGFCS